MELSSCLHLERAGPVPLQVKRVTTMHDLSLVPETHRVGRRKQTLASCPLHMPRTKQTNKDA